MPTDTVIEKKRRRVAADYRRQGYRVSRPNGGATAPSFLQDFRPDLIAERDDDHVVIEIKHAESLRGSNDLAELATRIAAQPGWRLELVALGSDGDEAQVVSNPDWLEAMFRHHADAGATIFHMLYLGQMLEFLVRGAAILNGINVRDKAVERIARELAFAGLMQQRTLDRIELALDYRNRLMHGPAVPPPQTANVTDITELCRHIYAECVASRRKQSSGV